MGSSTYPRFSEPTSKRKHPIPAARARTEAERAVTRFFTTNAPSVTPDFAFWWAAVDAAEAALRDDPYLRQVHLNPIISSAVRNWSAAHNPVNREAIAEMMFGRQTPD